MVVTGRRVGRSRVLLASGGLLGVVALTTTAFFTDFADLEAQVDGSRNTFDIVVAGSAASGWSPAASDWAQADEAAYLIDLGDATELPPGGTKHMTIAVRNASPRLAGDVAIVLSDPDPRYGATDPETGRFLELFDQLSFVLSEHGEQLLATGGAAPASERQTMLPGPLGPGEIREIEVAISLPAATDDRWQQASTQIQFRFEAVNSVA